MENESDVEMRVLVIGGGAQAKYALETFYMKGIKVCAVMNIKKSIDLKWARNYNCKVIPVDYTLENAYSMIPTHAIVCMPGWSEKEEWINIIKNAGIKTISAIHERAVVASTAVIGEAVIINANAVVQPFATIGTGAMVHACSIVEHDSVVGEYANLAPGARMAGWSRLGVGSTVFTGANLIPKVKVGKGSIVAAGSTVTKDVPDGVLVAGSPAKFKKKIK